MSGFNPEWGELTCGVSSSDLKVTKVFSNLLTTTYSNAMGFRYIRSDTYANSIFTKKSTDGKEISWYSDKAEYMQFNSTENTYYYIAIG